MKPQIKPWSISTTVRNPERIRSFLSVLKMLENETWNKVTQKKFQIMLIQYKFYGIGEKQFYSGLNLTQSEIDLLETPDVMDYANAESILDKKNYVGGGDMRGRQSFNPIEKMGLAYLDKNILKISSFGDYFLQNNYDLGEVFFRSFLKWQLPVPNSSDYKNHNIKPFIATLHLINEVNKICVANNIKAKGISKTEFALFGITLFDYKDIKKIAKEVINFRGNHDKFKTEKEKITFIDDYIKNNLSHIEGTNNLNDYADNVIRYFRLTRYIYIRGNGWYIDLEPRRMVEIQALLNSDDASSISFNSYLEYQNYICDITLPILPWETKKELLKISIELVKDIQNYQTELTSKNINFNQIVFADFQNMSENNLKINIETLRNYRKDLQQAEIHFNSQSITEIQNYKNDLQNIFKSKSKKPVELEHLVSLSLNALNDAIAIKPNYPVGDDNQPTFTAPANKPDIECFYQDFNAICEVTMLTNRQQWYAEGQPVMRHFRDFENLSQKECYCIFVAPTLHRDTINTYWMSVKYEYEGTKQKIVPFTISQFNMLLDTLIFRRQKGSKIYHKELKVLFEDIIALTQNVSNSDKWLEMIPKSIQNWQKNIQK